MLKRVLLFICVALFCANLAHAGEAWRLKIKEAAIVQGDEVLLGEIAEPINLPEDIWAPLAKRKLWPAPSVNAKAMQINKVRLYEALEQSLGADLATLCILPSALAIQKGGVVYTQDDLRTLVIDTLNPELKRMDGRAELSNFRLPSYMFLANKGQKIEVEPLQLKPGLVSLRFNVLEMDNSVIKRFTGTCFLDLWQSVPVAAKPINKNTELKPDDVTFATENVAYIKGDIWNGKTGPHELIRSIGAGQVIMLTDLKDLAVVRKGSVVNLNYAKANVQLSVVAEVLASAGVGETVLVKNMQSQKQVYAKVIDSENVLVF